MTDSKNIEIQLPEFAHGAKVISTNVTRMGGSLSHLKLPNGIEAFLKVTKSFERLETLREKCSLESLKNLLHVPSIVDFEDDGETATILLEKVSGAPMHEVVGDIGAEKTIVVISEILNTLWGITPESTSGVPFGLQEELQEINTLLEKNLINVDKFQDASEGKSPEEVYLEAKEIISSRCFDVLSHGDFCLPNIMITEKGEWSLIDWGKGGFSDRYRDLSAMEGSLKRNIGVQAYPNLLERLNIDKSPEEIKEYTKVYDSLDLFWYNARIS